MSEKNVASAVAYYQAMNRKDLSVIEKYLHPEVRLIGPLADITGKGEVLNSVKHFLTIFNKLTIRAQCGAENQVMLAYDLDCPSLIGILQAAVLISFRDDLISRIELFFDPRPVLLRHPDPIVYKGMTVNQLTEAYDDYKAIPNFDVLLHENRERAQTVKARLNPIHNVAYGTEIIQKLDIYAPKNAEKMPVLISIHGGGWTMGSKNTWAIPAEILMSKGIISVPIDHGLAPQYRMEDIIAHVRHAVAWAYKNIAQYGGDPNRLYIYGMSAGAHLASTTLMPSWHKHFGLPEDVIKGLIALSGIYDLCTLVHAPQADSQKALHMTLEEARRDSPFYHLPKHSIPAIIAHGEKEPLILYHLEANNYAQELQKAGCDVSLIEVPDANHFDMINELANTEGKVFKAVMKML